MPTLSAVHVASPATFLVAYAAFLGVVVEGAIIDTDHWRHFYLLLALIWGLMAGQPRVLHRNS